MKPHPPNDPDAEKSDAREQLDQLQATLNVIPAYAWYASASGGLRFVNKRTADYLGLPKDHPLRFGIDVGAPWDAHIPFLHPEDREGSRNDWSVRVRTGEASEYNFRVRNAQGGYRWFLSRVEPLRAGDGTLLQWVGVNLDIEELKCSEQALRESEAKFRDYAETASDWFWEIGPDYKFTMLTENAFGSDPASRIGTTCWDHALDLETEPEKWRLVRGALDARRPFRDFVYCTLGGDGSPMYVKAGGRPVFDAVGEFRGYRGTGADVTAIVRVQRAESQLAAIISSSSDAIIGKSLDGIVTSWNAGAEKMFGYGALEMIGQSITRIIPIEMQQEENAILGRLRQGDRIKNYETVRIRKDGSRIDISLTVSPVFGPTGSVVGASKIARDITAEKRAEAEMQLVREELARVARITTLGQLTASIGHEIAQPISSARNNARAALNFLDKEPRNFAEIREALACVVADTGRAGQIVDRIRDQTKKVPPRRDGFDLNGAIDEVIRLLQGEIANNRVSVRTRLADGQCVVRGDRVQLQQVVMNLVLNAIEAMGSVEDGPRELLISTDRKHAGGVLVAVTDSGPGIDPEHLERVFEAFYTTKSGGTGMGLAICRSIIDAHGGRMWADAIEPAGTVFRFTLPSE